MTCLSFPTGGTLTSCCKYTRPSPAYPNRPTDYDDCIAGTMTQSWCSTVILSRWPSGMPPMPAMQISSSQIAPYATDPCAKAAEVGIAEAPTPKLNLSTRITFACSTTASRARQILQDLHPQDDILCRLLFRTAVPPVNHALPKGYPPQLSVQTISRGSL